MSEFDIIIDKIYEKFNPVSIFIYGSRATNSYNLDSDYEIGMIFENNYVSRKEINGYVNNKMFSIFPFKLEEVLNYSIDTPFQKSLFINSLIISGKTVRGKEIIETLDRPVINNTDLLMDVRFNLGYAMASIRSYKENNIKLANELFYKSCLFATRDLVYYLNNKLGVSYNDIYSLSKEINISDEYKEIIEVAYNYRNKIIDEIDEAFFYKNISYINKYIEDIII